MFETRFPKDPGGTSNKEPTCNASDIRHGGLIPGSGRFPWRRAWQPTPVHLEYLNTYSSILAWRLPWTEQPGSLQFMELQRVRHDWATNIIAQNGPSSSMWTNVGERAFRAESCLLRFDIVQAGKKVFSYERQERWITSPSVENQWLPFASKMATFSIVKRCFDILRDAVADVSC